MNYLVSTSPVTLEDIERLLVKVCPEKDEFWAEERPTIGTHDGRFHLDEVLATAMLLSLPEWNNARILRSRIPEKLAKCDILVDVGGEYDPDSKRFDHHQRGFSSYFNFDSDEEDPIRAVTKLSSAGLVFSHYGEQLLRTCFGISDDEHIKAMKREVYIRFIEAVDANDNGVPIVKEGEPQYIEQTTLPCRVASLYPDMSKDAGRRKNLRRALGWQYFTALSIKNLENKNPECAATCDTLRQGMSIPFDWLQVPINGGEPEEIWAFKQAIQIAYTEFARVVTYLRDSWLPGLQVLREAIRDQRAGDMSQHVVELAKWSVTEGHIYSLERGLGLEPIKFLVYPTERASASGNDGKSWTVRCVPEEGQGFKSRLPLYSGWRGLRDQDLGATVISAAGTNTEIKNEDFVFCHATGFMGIARTRTAAYEMVRQTLLEAAKKNDAS